MKNSDTMSEPQRDELWEVTTLTAKTIMIQGTASDVGKSFIATALCRIFAQAGYRVAPFKAHNMSTNSYVTATGGEIGLSQGRQAEAAGVTATIHMNPLFIRPQAGGVCQVLIQGVAEKNYDARDYHNKSLDKYRAVIKESLAFLREEYDIVVIEGSGSPAEINLKERDLANMAVARLAKTPVMLVADIHRGGAFASLLGTMAIFTPQERQMVAGYIINKYSWDKDLLQAGCDFLKVQTGKPVLGIIPYTNTNGRRQQPDYDAMAKLVKKHVNLPTLFRVMGV